MKPKEKNVKSKTAASMKWSMCKCEIRGLVRPEGPIKITKTDMISSDVLVANLTGPVKAKVATVRANGKYFVIAPEKLGGMREVPADSLTDGLHAAVWSMGEEIKNGKLLSEGKKLSREKQLKAIKGLRVADEMAFEEKKARRTV